MNSQEILKKIGGIIAELKDQYTYLEASGNSFNELELELFMANANFLTDHIEILKKIHHQVKPIALPNAEPIFSADKDAAPKLQIPDYFSEEELYAEEDNQFNINVPPVENFVSKEQEIVPTEASQQKTILLPESISENIANDQPEIRDASFTEQKAVEPENLDVHDTSFIDQKVEEAEMPNLQDASFIEQKTAKPEIMTSAEKENIFSEPEVEPVQNVSVQPEVNNEPEQEAESANFVVEKVQPELVKPSTIKQEDEQVLTLNQRIAAQRTLDQQKAEATKSSPQKVQDLQSLISLNDKLLFVKELFNGYNLAYSEAINILNRYQTFTQAEQFLNLNYAIKNNWKEKPATSERFFELLRKKFS